MWVGSSPTGPIQWIYREWVQELGFSEDCNNWAWSWVDWITNIWGEVWNFILGLDPKTGYSYCFFSAWLQKLFRMVQTATVFPKLIFRPFFPGTFLTLYTSFSLMLAFHFVDMQVFTWVLVPSAALSNFLWVAATKVVLFRGHFLINVARSLAVGV